MSGWQTLSSKTVYETPWIKVRADEVINHLGEKIEYSVVSTPHPGVTIIATNTKGEILFQEIYRYTINKTVLELPAGGAEDGDILKAARRELLEEANMESDDWAEVGQFNMATGSTTFSFYAFVARNVRQTDNIRTKNPEQIDNHRFLSLQDIEKLTKNNKLIDAPMLGAIYAAKAKGLIGE